jgi:TolA-binding protein
MIDKSSLPHAARRLGRRVGRSALVLTAILALAGVRASATGQFEEEPAIPLADYLRLDQLPAKSAEEIRDETRKKKEPEAPPIKFAAELLDLSKKPGPQALASLDRMITAARAKANNALLNLLHDLHDIYAGPATAAETTEYVEWRMEQADQFGVRFEEPKPGAPEPERKPPNKELVADIERHMDKASPALKPHWLCLLGAVDYLSHDMDLAQDHFLEVAKKYPKSARAEVGLYMAARCQVWRSRAENYTQQDMQLVATERPRAKKLWEEYLAKYPHGWLYGDALGWYAAYAYDGQDYGTALRYYAQQLDLPDHPELEDMAAIMVGKTLSHIASAPNDKAFAEVAKHPQAAQALVYLVINTSESDNYNGKLDSIDEVRGWRKKVLPHIGAAISAQSKLYQDADWKPRYLAMLAYATSGAGQHEQAAKLLQGAGAAAENSDDLLMARGAVLHRAKRPTEAAKALQTLLEKFPKSPLAKGARLRLALALTDDHRGGEAVLALHELLPKPKDERPKPDAAANPADPTKPDATPPEPETEAEDVEFSGHDAILYPIDVQQVRALIDTLLNFAPIEELAAAAGKPGLDPVLRLLLTEPAAQRLLAREQFDEAKKFMTPAQFGLLAAGLETLTVAAREAKDPAARAAACLKLGNAWAEARGKLLTFPLDTDERRHDAYLADAALANVRRADSAPFVGATGNYRLDLENRDELRHAFNWWIEASDALPRTPQTAVPLWRALKAMPQIVDVSPFTVQRAAARKWDDVSRKLYERLHTECPVSVEAMRYAVFWDFALPKKEKTDDSMGEPARGAAGDGSAGATVFDIDSEPGDYQSAEVFKGKMTGLHEAAAGDLAAARKMAENLQVQVRDAFPGLYSARWVNLVDDLALFLSEPDPGAGVRKRYADLRFWFFNKSAIGGGYGDEGAAGNDEELLKTIQEALADPSVKPVADYFDFLRLAVVANHFVFEDIKQQPPKEVTEDQKDADTFRTRDYPTMEKEAKAFLEKYPHSKKREAATLLYARAVYRNSEQVALPKIVTWPQAPRWEGGNQPAYTQREPFDPKKVLAALDAYDREFPQGRYAPDIRYYRAAVAFRQQNWKTALDLTLAQIGGTENPALDAQAADLLGAIFAQIADERYRADVLAAIKADPRARKRLEKYLAYESDTHPLLYMKTWVRQQLAGK